MNNSLKLDEKNLKVNETNIDEGNGKRNEKNKINKTQNKNDIDTNILNLKIISKIREYDKLNTQQESNLLEINSPKMFQGLGRWFNSENRNITMEKLNEILGKTFEITDKLIFEEKKVNRNHGLNNMDLEENNSQIFQRFILEMTNSLSGLENLKKTYSEDILISSQLDLLISKLNNRLEKMNKLVKLNL